MFKKILCFVGLLTECVRLRSKPSLKPRWLTPSCGYGIKTVVGSHSQRMDGTNVTIVNPKPNCGLKLRNSGSELVNPLQPKPPQVFLWNIAVRLFWSAHRFSDELVFDEICSAFRQETH